MKNKLVALAAGILSLFAASAPAQTAISALYSFPASGTSGAGPSGQLVAGTDGYLYGTAKTGGAYTDPSGVGCGVLYKVNLTNGAFTLLASFNFTNGARPDGELIFDNTSTLHGATKQGGLNGSGTLFASTTNVGGLSSVYSFNFNPRSGFSGAGYPSSSLVQGTDSNYYGVTPNGGSARAGVVYQFTSGGVFNPLYNFSGVGALGVSADGSNPEARLLQLTNTGNFYGITPVGGTNDVYYNGDGTIFCVNSNGAFTNIYCFIGTNSGAKPVGQLIQGSDGYIYGVTSSKSTNSLGAVYKLNTNTLALTVLAAFNGTNGAYPTGKLVQGPDGYLYGICAGFATNGSIYQVSTNGNGGLTNMAVFAFTNGFSPAGGMVYVSNALGSGFYGTAIGGGSGSNGVVYDWAPYPVFTNQPLSATSTTGTKVTLFATAVGPPNVTYFWIHTNLVSTTGPGISNYVNSGIGQIVISNVAVSNLGTYYLVASNFYGVTTSSVALLQ